MTPADTPPELSEQDSNGALLDELVTSRKGGLLLWRLDPPVTIDSEAKSHPKDLADGLSLGFCTPDVLELSGCSTPLEGPDRKAAELLDAIGLRERLAAFADNGYRLEEHSFTRPDQQTVHVLTLCLHSGNTLTGILNCLREGSGWLQHEPESQLTQQLLADVQSMAGIGTWSSNFRGQFEFQTPQVAVLFGLPPTRHYSFEEILERVHPADRDKLAQNRLAAMQTEDIVSVEFRVLSEDGIPRHMLSRTRTVMDANGEPARWLGSVQEVTLDKIRGEALRQQAIVVASISEAVIVTDLELRISDWNNGAVSMFGHSADRASGQGFDELLKPCADSRPAFTGDRAAWLAAIDGWRGELTCQCEDGSAIICEASITALSDDQGTPLSLIHVIRNVDDRKQQEAQLASAKEAAERANQVKTRFIQGLSHEMRTPLNAILGFAQLLDRLQTSPLSDLQLEYVNQIRAGGEHLLELVNDVLDLARIEAGELKLWPEELVVASIMDSCLEQLRNLAHERQVSIDTSYDDDGDIVADPTRLKQVLFNLLSNGVKYNSSPGVLTLRIESTDTDHLRIRVRDTGPGISEDALAALYEPFNRLGVTDVDVEGTGLGLPITRELVEAMGGTMGVDSSPGEGSEFWVELPRVPTTPN